MTTLSAATFRVVGMTCAHCVSAVRAEVRAIDGVDSVEVDLPAGTVTITSESPVPVGSVAAAVREAGYDLVDGESATPR